MFPSQPGMVPKNFQGSLSVMHARSPITKGVVVNYAILLLPANIDR